MTAEPRQDGAQGALADAEDALRRACRAVAMARNVDLVCLDGPRAQARFITIALREVDHVRSSLRVRTLR